MSRGFHSDDLKPTVDDLAEVAASFQTTSANDGSMEVVLRVAEQARDRFGCFASWAGRERKIEKLIVNMSVLPFDWDRKSRRETGIALVQWSTSAAINCCLLLPLAVCIVRLILGSWVWAIPISIFIILGLHLVLFKRQERKERMLAAFEKFECPKCQYELQDLCRWVMLPDGHRWPLSPPRCPECGKAWPLIPPPV